MVQVTVSVVCRQPKPLGLLAPGVCRQQAWHSPAAAVQLPMPLVDPLHHVAPQTTCDTLHGSSSSSGGSSG
jgi:hypothetical protein